MAFAFTSYEELREWLEGRPSEWAQIIALRSALRVAPLAIDPLRWKRGSINPRLISAVFRACAITWAARRIPADDTVGVTTAAHAAARAASFNIPSPPPSSLAAEAVSSAARDAVDASDGAYAVSDASDAAAANVTGDYTAADLGRAADFAATANDEANTARVNIWKQVSLECAKLDEGTAPDALLYSRLWEERPEWFQDDWGRAAQLLSRPADGFEIWREWYFGRLEGLPHAFDRFNAAADQDFYRWIIEQDDDWWKREPVGAVNADIKTKVEELRRPAPPRDEELEQNPRAFTFSLNADGKTELDEELLPNGLSGDQDERDNHSEIVRLVDNALLATAGETNAKDMDDPTQSLRDAIGKTVEELRPRFFVLRARELIRQVNERESGDSLKPPLSEKQRDAYVPLVAALEMIAEFSPKLAELWYGKMGQSGPPLTREMLDLIAQAFRQSQQTTELAQSMVEASNALVAPDAPEDDAARIAASETSRNVVRKIGGALKKADEGAKSVDRVVRLSDRAVLIWNALKGRIPSNETIARILDWISGAG